MTMTVEDFIEELGTEVEVITYDAAAEPGITKSADGKTVNVKNVSLTGGFSTAEMWGVIIGSGKTPSSLIKADLRGLDTSNVKNMESMFRVCEKLVSLDLSSFNTSNVNDMEHMFNNCGNLASLYLSSFDTSNVKNITDMFFKCGKNSENPLVIKYDIENWTLGTNSNSFSGGYLRFITKVN